MSGFFSKAVALAAFFLLQALQAAQIMVTARNRKARQENGAETNTETPNAPAPPAQPPSGAARDRLRLAGGIWRAST